MVLLITQNYSPIIRNLLFDEYKWHKLKALDKKCFESIIEIHFYRLLKTKRDFMKSIPALTCMMVLLLSPIYSFAAKVDREDNHFFAHAFWAPVQMPFPMAWGAEFGANLNNKWTLALDYTSSAKELGLFGFQLGSIDEKTYAIQLRRFIGNSFNFKFALGQRTLETTLPKDWLDLALKDYTLLASKIQSNFIRVGLSNQWVVLGNKPLVVDWISLNIPFSGEVLTSVDQFANSPANAKRIRNAEGVLKYYPSGAIVKVGFGLMF